MKIYLLIPNELLLSSGHIGQKASDTQAKITIGFDESKLMVKTTINFPLEIRETESLVPCECCISNNHLSVNSANDIVNLKPATQPNTEASLQLLTLCDQI